MSVNSNHIRKTKRHSGFILIAVLVCLSVIGALIFSALQTSLRQRKQLDREMQMEQTCLLAEGGIVHAIELIESSNAELKTNSVVIAPAMYDTKQAEVKIELTRNENVVDVNVTAWIGLKDRPETQTRQTLTTKVDISSEE